MKWLHGKNLFLICVILMIFLHQFFFIKELVPDPLNYSGIVIILLGLLVAISVARQFKKLDTEIHTFGTPRKLVTSGLFKFSRNPCYVGFAISLIGVWILLGTFLPIFGCLLFILTSNFWHIPYEEKSLKKEFDEEYKAYKSKVRRWL